MGERLTYGAKYGLFSVGTAVMEVVGIDTVHRTEAVHFRFRITGGAQLAQDLTIRTDTTLGPLGLTGTPQLYVSGTRAASNATAGNTYTITYDQFVGFNDAPVNPPHVYHITITWAAAGTF